MTRFSLLLVACTATLGLAAGQSAQDDSRPRFRPVELQVGASFVEYDSKDTSWDRGTASFTPKGLGLAPSVRFTFEPISLPFGGLGFTAGYRMGNDVPLEYWGETAKADMQHKGQISLGAILRIAVAKRFDFGLGFETRNDWMHAAQLAGTETEQTIWRPWLRANARYLFDRGTNVTPFVGAEAAFALQAVEVNARNHYHDYVMNTGDAPLGAIDPYVASPESFTRGHMPLWEVAVVGGVRFGRHAGCGPAAPAAPKAEKPKAEKPKAEKPKPEPEKPKPAPAAEKPKPEPVAEKPVAEIPVVVVEKPAPVVEAPVVVEKPAPVVEKKAEPQIVEIEGIRIHFVTNDSASAEANNRAIVKSWAAKYKNAVDPKALVVTGHADKRGSHAHNLALSTRRANTLAGYLRAEGVNIPAANVKGRSWDEPIADNETPEGLAKNRRAELGVNSPNYRIKSMMEGNIVGVR